MVIAQALGQLEKTLNLKGYQQTPLAQMSLPNGYLMTPVLSLVFWRREGEMKAL